MDQQWTPCDNCHFSGENYRDKELLLWFMNDHDNSSHNDKNYDQQWTPGENYHDKKLFNNYDYNSHDDKEW